MVQTSSILAIDLGRFNAVACWFELATRAASFQTLPTTPNSLRAAIERQPDVTVVIEACSSADWVTDLCDAMGTPEIVAATHGPAWPWRRSQRKTDRDDDLKLARLAAVGELQPVVVPAQARRRRGGVISSWPKRVGDVRSPTRGGEGSMAG